MSKKRRRTFSTEEKLSILKRHLVGKENVSDICEELDLHPNQFYKWQGELFSMGPSFFHQKESRPENLQIKKLRQENENLTRTIHKKDTVIAEITEDYVRLKKNAAETFNENG